MRISGTNPGGPGYLNDAGDAQHKAKQLLPTGEGVVDFGNIPRADASALFKQQEKPAQGEGGITGLAGKLSDATALIPGVSNAFKGVAESDGSLGGAFKGVVSKSVETAETSAKGILKGAMNGEVSPQLIAKNALVENYQTNEQTPEAVRNLSKFV